MSPSNAPVAKQYIGAIFRELLAPVLYPKGGRRPRTWRVVSWDAEQGFCLTLDRGGTILLLELEDRDERRDCYTRTARFNVCVRRYFEAQAPLAEADRRLVDAIVEVVRRREGRLPEVERTKTGRRRAVREIEVERVLVPEGQGHYYLNPYVGCMIGCDFCYVADRADMSRRFEGLPKLPWGHWVDVKTNAAEILRREVRHYRPGVVRMSPILTDPYQSVERHYRITRQCLEVLLEGGFAPAILTRAARVVEDLDLLRRFPKAAVGFSIPSDDDRMRAIFEPGGDPVEARLDALRQCRDAGLHTLAVIQPVLPMDPEALVDRLAPLIRAVRVDRMYGLQRMWHYYRDNDLLWATTDDFFRDMSARLLDGFRARGIVIDEMDDLVRLLGLADLRSDPARGVPGRARWPKQ